ncbi:cyclophilin-like fold protein [Pseudomonas lijiangensis]|uniref:cyclophilin-like fold protein n=1 Tax=Pseudomonas syringae group TaxID=136849 RepID=UPI001EEED5EF|nr:cyclophilin-like fold protein [Pseudomonas cichorii]
MAKRPEDNQISGTKTTQALAFVSCLTASLFVPSEANARVDEKQGGCMEASQKSTSMRSIHVVMKAAEGMLVFKLDDIETATAFTDLLPLELTLEDYAETEKITYLPRKLNTRGAPEGYTPVQGDLAYYAPWGNLAIFHKSFSYSPGLVRLGTLLSGMDILRKSGATKVRIELERQV